MTLQDLMDKDVAAKTLHGKSLGQLACKYFEPIVDLSAHTPQSDVYQETAAAGRWRLTQAGAKKVGDELKRAGIILPPIAPSAWYQCDGTVTGQLDGSLPNRVGWTDECTVYAITRNVSASTLHGFMGPTTTNWCEVGRFISGTDYGQESYLNVAGTPEAPLPRGDMAIPADEWVETLFAVKGNQWSYRSSVNDVLITDTTTGVLDWSAANVHTLLASSASNGTVGQFTGDIARLVICDKRYETFAEVKAAANRFDLRFDADEIYDISGRIVPIPSTPGRELKTSTDPPPPQDPVAWYACNGLVNGHPITSAFDSDQIGSVATAMALVRNVDSSVDARVIWGITGAGRWRHLWIAIGSDINGSTENPRIYDNRLSPETTLRIPNDGEWHEIVASVNGDWGKIWIDDVLLFDQQLTATLTGAQVTQSNLLSSESSIASSRFVGDIARLCVDTADRTPAYMRDMDLPKWLDIRFDTDPVVDVNGRITPMPSVAGRALTTV